MRKLVLILLTVASFTIQAQVQFVEEEVNQILFEEINKLRENEGLNYLKSDEILDAVAFDQGEYIMNLGRISHEQDQAKKKDLMSRILFYEGKFAQAGENAAMVTIGSKEAVDVGGERLEINTNLKAVRAALTSWLKEKEGKLNLMDPQFYTLGTSVIIDESEELILVAVFASESYVVPNGYKTSSNFYGVDRFDETTCKSFLENNGTLPQLFSDALKVEDGQVFFEYHSLGFMEELLSDGGDAIAVDIVEDSQFECGKGNSLYPSEIADGFMMAPSKKGKLLAYNLDKDKGEVKFNLGELPGFYNSKTSELNAIIIKDGHYCQTIPFNKIITKNLKVFNQPFVFAGKKDTSVFQWADSSVYKYEHTESWRASLEELFRKLKLINYEYTAIDINQITSPTSDPIPEAELRALVKEVSGSDISVWFKNTFAWEEYNAFEKGSFHQLETVGMDNSAKLEYLKVTSETDTSLAAFLKGLNKIEVVVQGTASVEKEASIEDKIIVLEFLLTQSKIEPALFIQVDLIEAVKHGDLKKEQLPIVDPKQKQLTLPLINNQIILAAINGENNYGGNSFYLAFLELYLINKKQVEISFNMHINQLKYWSESINNIDDLKSFGDWEDEFIKLQKSSVPDSAFAKGMLNYFIVAADYYFEKQEFDKRKKAFDEIMKWQSKAKLSEKETLELAQYLCFQDQFTRGIELLRPMLSGDKVNDEILFYFLQIAIYDQELVSQKNYFEYLKKAQNLYPNKFCSLFSKQKMGMQLLKHGQVKDIYCANCN